MACAFLAQAPKAVIAMSMFSLPNFCIGSTLMVSPGLDRSASAPLRLGSLIGGYRLEKAFSSRNHNYSAPHKNNNERSGAHP
jgi:hypothetical protein